MNISNKTLAILLIAGMVLSISGTLITLNNTGRSGYTGLATTDTSEGTVNYTISSNVQINFSTADINFGSGYIDTEAGKSNCTMDTEGNTNISSSGCMGLVSPGDTPLILDNIGNKAVLVNISFDTVMATFLPNSAAGESELWFKVNDPESSCNSPSYGTYTAIPDTSEHQICDSMGFTPGTANSMEIDIKLAIDLQESGSEEMIITAHAYEV